MQIVLVVPVTVWKVDSGQTITVTLIVCSLLMAKQGAPLNLARPVSIGIPSAAMKCVHLLSAA